MEEAIVAALAEEGITAGPREGLTGVWVEDRKIGSIGVHVSRGVTTHGFAINVDNDLQPFEWVVPCGLEGVRMTSVTKETGKGDHLDCFRRRMALAFCTAFGRRQRLVTPERLARPCRYPQEGERGHRAHPRHPLPGEPRRDGRAQGPGRRGRAVPRPQAAVVQGAAARRARSTAS